MFSKKLLTGACFLLSFTLQAQTLTELTVEKIMRDPRWIGSSPSNIFWGQDGQTLYFNWNPDNAPADSIYSITAANRTPVKVSVQQKTTPDFQSNYIYNQSRSAFIYAKDGDIFYRDIKTGKTKRIVQTLENEGNPQFSFNETRIVYSRNQNLYAWDILSGETMQLTNTRTPDSGGGSTGRAAGGAGSNPQEQWLKNDQLRYFQVLKERKEKREATEAYNKSIPKEKEIRSINIEDKTLQGMNISPDGRYISYRLSRFGTGGKSTIVPSYVTETGFTTDINARTKVGTPQGSSELYVYDREKDTIFSISLSAIPGIEDLPDYVKDYPKQLEEKTKKPAKRAVSFSSMNWSPAGTNAVFEIRSQDNKDRWLFWFDPKTSAVKLLNRQRDEAWIGGPGTGFFGGGSAGWLNEEQFWFRSESTGYSHLYIADRTSGEVKAVTNGNYEVQQVQLSKDKKYFYIITNEVHPGEQHFYRLSIADGKKEKLSSMTGANQVSLSPDEKWLAILHSYSNKPWELYLQENKVNGKAEQITHKARSEEFNSYHWKDPQVIQFPARDGAMVYARVYQPAKPHPNKPAVLFVHGAGYLQNAHKWWSSYFREYMFNNLLADQGYYVMDIDYRGSAGYGRDWRTGIYRHMGGKDLTDHVDAVNYLVKNYGVNPAHVGLYGGSYGGFIALMGMFNEPNVFAAGAALRPVTDWANYNHGYTSNILNEPFTDSLAYRRSSPFYFAEGLKGHLLICHGMVDVNVHYQDAVKLAQRLIELGKDNWELASYPMEDHGFVEPSSWTDEYKRIYKLFENVLKGK
ncbi:MAG TPA: prolyl oligopeptidase family serine peptidase [Chitinophagaceae bacterium]|nr:prolyl oligopeptidase family serine peptidase [Chitinophagaceae bacterium]